MVDIKLIIFDLDGVLVETKNMHFETLNKALKSTVNIEINMDEHLSIYDGLSTKKKLELLTHYKNLSPKLYTDIYNKKQNYTLEYINNNLKYDNRLISVLKSLKDMGLEIYVASNAIYKTVKQTLVKSGFIDYIDYFITNEDVKLHKPHPEIYMKCFSRANILPKEAIILEDSIIGKKSAISSGAHLIPINTPKDVTLEKILLKIKQLKNLPNTNEKYIQDNMNIVIPMAGLGSRFSKYGYDLPKPLIDVKGMPMIQRVVENLNIKAKYIFIVREDHYKQYNLQLFLNTIAPDCKIIITNNITDGAARSVLLAKEYINNDDNLLIANSDQIIDWDSSNFMYHVLNKNIDGAIVTFKSDHPKWSYVKIDSEGFVTEVAEKNVISNIATVGLYYYTKGKDFVYYSEQMIKNNNRTLGEFYIAPVYNEMIKDHKKIITQNCQEMWGIGTPEDLDYYLKYN